MQTVERIETTINLPKDLLEQARDLAQGDPLSNLIEEALRALIKKAMRNERDKRELEVINRNAAALNAEALDVLEYQQINW
jgi:hypothetical protein